MIHRLKKIWLVLNSQERQYTLALIAIFSIALIGVVWFFVTTITKQVAAPGGSFREGVAGQPTTLNPLLAQNQAEEDLIHLLFSPLSQITETIELSKNSQFWTVRLKEGLTWHDKEPLTSDDLVFTIQQIQDPSAQSPLFAYWQGAQVERLSEREVKITPPANSSPLLFQDQITRLLLIPQHIFSAIPPQNWSLSEYNLKPIGNGPYQFQKMVLHSDGFLESYTLTDFDSKNTEHNPYIQTIIVKFFKDADEAKTNFRYGKIDGLGGIDPYEAKSIARPSETHLYKTPGYYAVFMNQSQNDLLKDKAIRQALDEATPRTQLVKEVLNDYGSSLAAPFISPEETRPNNPQTILESAGWIKNTSGKIERANGNNTTPTKALELTVPNLPFLEHTAQILKTSWENLGFTVTIKTVASDKVVREIVPRRDYQMLLFGNIPQPGEDLYPFWHSSQIFHPGLNLSLYKNSKLDSILSDIRKTTSTAARTSQLRAVGQTLRDDVPAIFLYSPDYVYLTTKQLQGLQPTDSFLFEADRFGDVADWHLRTRRVLK